MPTIGTVIISGASNVIDNSAPSGNGGGIYDANTATYGNLTTGPDTTFAGNTASVAAIPPANAASIYSGIGFDSTTITNHPLNNFDINYQGELLTYHITYEANGGMGSHVGPGIRPLDPDTVLTQEDTGITREGYTFTGWNTQADGSGTAYSPGDVITMTHNVTLYAQWKVNQYIVNFVSNGGTSVPNQTVDYGAKVTKPVDPTRTGYTFEGWYTDDGTFVSPGTLKTVS